MDLGVASSPPMCVAITGPLEQAVARLPLLTLLWVVPLLMRSCPAFARVILSFRLVFPGGAKLIRSSFTFMIQPSILLSDSIENPVLFALHLV